MISRDSSQPSVQFGPVLEWFPYYTLDEADCFQAHRAKEGVEGTCAGIAVLSLLAASAGFQPNAEEGA